LLRFVCIVYRHYWDFKNLWWKDIAVREVGSWFRWSLGLSFWTDTNSISQPSCMIIFNRHLFAYYHSLIIWLLLRFSSQTRRDLKTTRFVFCLLLKALTLNLFLLSKCRFSHFSIIIIIIIILLWYQWSLLWHKNCRWLRFENDCSYWWNGNWR
jgi:hypothetical protein